MEKNLFFCSEPVQFLQEVARIRGQDWDSLEILLQGDSGQGYLKVACSLLPKEELRQELQRRMEAAGILHLGEEEQDDNKGRKKRRTRDEGIGGGEEFKPWGARKLLILALVHKVPETGFNLDLIFTACKIHLLNFKITGDFAFLLPCLAS